MKITRWTIYIPAMLLTVLPICGCTMEKNWFENEKNMIIAKRQASIFPAAADREKWLTINKSERGRKVVDTIIADAEKILQEPVPQLSAELFMRFLREGNRIDYENIYFQRRHNLDKLVIAECFEYKGRFLDKIVDYIWDITSEHTWVIPAHCKDRFKDPLPFNANELDLFSTTTGFDLATVLNLLEPELTKISPNLVKTVKQELITRIIEPLEIRPLPFWWIHSDNNWRPWCCRNVLGVVLTVLKDQPERREALVKYLKEAVDDYVKIYSSDGCCDEGPHYWTVNPVMVQGFYELLQSQPQDTEKYALMAEYILHVRASQTHFFSFADAAATTDVIPVGACCRFAERIGNPKLRDLGMNGDILAFRRSTSLFCKLTDIFWTPMDVPTPELPAEQFKYYDRLQVLFLKDRGIAFAAKRGFENSHCHMDIGQFIIFNNDKPVVIDLGGTLYTKSTFDNTRFQNWIINTEGHNVPQFNGIGQIQRSPQDAGACKIFRNEEKCVFTMDLTSAYPREAQLVKCERIITYNYSDQSVEVFDSWELERDNNTVRVPLYTTGQVRMQNNSCQIGNMELSISGDQTAINHTPMVVKDSKVNASWGENFNRIDVVTSCGKKGSRKMHFRRISE